MRPAPPAGARVRLERRRSRLEPREYLRRLFGTRAGASAPLLSLGWTMIARRRGIVPSKSDIARPAEVADWRSGGGQSRGALLCMYHRGYVAWQRQISIHRILSKSKYQQVLTAQCVARPTGHVRRIPDCDSEAAPSTWLYTLASTVLLPQDTGASHAADVAPGVVIRIGRDACLPRRTRQDTTRKRD